MSNRYGRIFKGHDLPYGTMAGASPELHNAYYSNGYKNDEWLPELPCPPQDEEPVCLEEQLYRKEVSEFVQKVLDEWDGKILTRQQVKVLVLRFGIGLDEERTLEQVGNIFELTRERIRQIEAKAIRRLKQFDFGLREVFEPEIWYETTCKKNTKEKSI